MRNANAVGQPKGGVGPSLAAQGFVAPITLSHHRSAQALDRRHRERRLQRLHPGRGHHRAGAGREHLRGQRRFFSRIVGKHGAEGRRRGPLQPDQHPPRRDLQRQLRLQRVGNGRGLCRLSARRAVQLYAGAGKQLLQPQPLYGGLCAGQLEAPSRLLPSITACAGIASAPGARNSTNCKRWSRASSRRSFPARRRGWSSPATLACRLAGPGAQRLFSALWHRVHACLHHVLAAPADRLCRARPASALGYGIFYTAYEGLSAGIMSANPPYGYTYTSAAPPLFSSPFTVAATRRRRGAALPAAEGALRRQPGQSRTPP